MYATCNFVLERFNKFNILFFENKLPPVPISLTRSTKCLGRCQFYTVNSRIGPKKNFGYVIKITGVVDLTERELEDIIIHEMIHYYIAFNGFNDTSTHGRIFKSIMNNLNFTYGRNISVYHKPNGEQSTDYGKSYILCVSLLKSGEKGVTVCARTRFFDIYRSLPKFYDINNIQIYLSYDNFFEKYPRSIKPCVYKISIQDLELHLKDAQELVVEDDNLKFKKLCKES